VTRWLGREHVHLPVCGSTNDEAARLASAGAAHGTVVTAGAQHAGRGRQGRVWHSPPGENLYLSCILRPALPPVRVPAITLAAGLGVTDAVARIGARPALKWPNDVLVDGRKLSGILTEMSTRGQHVQHIVVGIGINLGSQSFPPELAGRATSLALLGLSIERERFFADLLASLEHWFERFFAGGVAALADAWLARADRSRVGATSEGRAVEGAIVGLDPDGCLLVEDDAGARHRIIAGDVLPVPEM
jgi:BirA family biotin operon repressor/biotin-[acetyl-CoA-carboxylase] ligase